MQSSLVSLSNELAKLVEEFQPHVVAVHGRAHYPSSGVLWRPGVIVTADHTVARTKTSRSPFPAGSALTPSWRAAIRERTLPFSRWRGWDQPPLRPPAAEAAKVGELALVLGRSPNSGPERQPGSHQRRFRPVEDVAGRAA